MLRKFLVGILWFVIFVQLGKMAAAILFSLIQPAYPGGLAVNDPQEFNYYIYGMALIMTVIGTVTGTLPGTQVKKD